MEDECHGIRKEKDALMSSKNHLLLLGKLEREEFFFCCIFWF